MKILFDRPAEDMLEALPVGNGRLGALVYGQVLREQAVLNENSMWSGSQEQADREDAAEYLPRIRKLLAEGKNYEAERLFAEHFTCKGKGTNYAHGSTVPFGCYQTLGRLNLSYFQAISSGRQDSCGATDYERFLDLDTGIAKVRFRLGGKEYEREWLVSWDQEAIWLHLSASEPGQISVSCGLDRDERFLVERLPSQQLPGLLMSGQLEDGYGTDKGVRYACALGAFTRGGCVEAEGQRLHIREADEAWIVLTARTDLAGFMGRKGGNPVKAAVCDLEEACRSSWEDVKKRHRDAYEGQYHSLQLQFGDEKEEEEKEEVSTPERLKRFLAGEKDAALAALYVQFARYQLICSSRNGDLPANLQGIWADEIQTPWNGDWHLNAQQMIYWLAEKGNLSDCHVPYLELTRELVEPGKKTAMAYYGARGWLAHTCTNPWGFTSPCEDAAWGSTTGSPAWQCHHLWEHYLYTQDEAYLKRAYPVMKGAMQFYLDMLVEDEQGRLITSPSSSPENAFLDEEGRRCSLCEGPAYDRELILALADSCIQAQYVLKDDEAFAAELIEKRSKLAPVEIASDGRIMEWGKEYPEALPHHRHLSHLWGVYPGSLISVEDTPELAQAAHKSLRMRGRTTAGWAIAYRMCLWARLRQGKEAYECLEDCLRYATAHNLMNLAFHCDETLEEPEAPDIDRCRYPFQIDGNQGNAAGILLMLLDDSARVLPDGTMETHLYLLPALPEALAQGCVRGLRSKGGLTVSMEWEKGKLIYAEVTGKTNGTVILHYEGGQEERLEGSVSWRYGHA